MAYCPKCESTTHNCTCEPEVCRFCDTPFTNEHPECELDSGYHRGGRRGGHCCIQSDKPTHWICNRCQAHYEPRSDNDLCPDCEDIDPCAENGHDWEVEGTIFEPDGFDNFHFHADLHCRECSVYGEACEDIGIQW